MAHLFSGVEPFVQFGKGHYEEQFCEIILNLDQQLWRNVIKRHFLSRALAAPLFGGAEPFVQFG